MKNPSLPKQKRENPLYSILFNIVLPVALLNQLSKHLGENGPTIALVVALAFPLVYGAIDYFKNHHTNYVSLLGIVNILFTGGLALFNLEGFWFAVKEAAFPLVMGLGVLASIFTRRPFIEVLALNDQVMNTSLIEEKLEEKQTEQQFHRHLRISTLLVSFSFFISSFLNFILAQRIFKPISQTLAQTQRSQILNEQIAEMTWMGYVVIALPLMVFMGFVMWHLVSGIKKLTGLEIGEVFHSPPN